MDRVDDIAAALAKVDGLDWSYVCPMESDGDDCGSGSCVAAHYENHDPDMARSQYRAYAKQAINILFDEPADHRSALTALCVDVHARNVAAGWWNDLKTGDRLDRNVGEMLCLVHSEISEAMEGHRKSLMDDKLPDRPMIEVELADAVIRIADIAGGLGLDLGGALVAKLVYNASRADHKAENRALSGGKAY